jgi:hypothetical protein
MIGAASGDVFQTNLKCGCLVVYDCNLKCGCPVVYDCLSLGPLIQAIQRLAFDASMLKAPALVDACISDAEVRV